MTDTRPADQIKAFAAEVKARADEAARYNAWDEGLCRICGRTNHRSDVPTLAGLVEMYIDLVDAQDRLMMCYRLGTRRGASDALDKLKRANKKIQRLATDLARPDGQPEENGQ